ncbi:hypothetical protein B0T14DRAFT_439782 [Immersiella caudata]|uniref:Uncharacterized protein n=1 Tax=Immersiella caudata TaxID=314043 RepID=A0AA39U4I2_9PEZI|nr:hypothetical protein B0T14DRAFT_439782 [Immersiella caudata]
MGNSDSKIANLCLPDDLAAQSLPHRFTATHKASFSKITALLSDPDHPDKPSFAITWPAGWYGSMIFHAGPTKDHPALAAAKTAGKLRLDFEVALPALPPTEQRTEILRYESRRMREKWWFAMQIGTGPDARVERFEWRRSHGAAVKGVAGGSGWGWKLVRMGEVGHGGEGLGGAGEGGSDGDDDGQTDGLTSDGKEVVAVWADAGLSLSRMGAFEFRGSGATGDLGLLWAVMALVTCMGVWQLRQQRNEMAAVT